MNEYFDRYLSTFYASIIKLFILFLMSWYRNFDGMLWMSFKFKITALVDQHSCKSHAHTSASREWNYVSSQRHVNGKKGALRIKSLFHRKTPLKTAGTQKTNNAAVSLVVWMTFESMHFHSLYIWWWTHLCLLFTHEILIANPVQNMILYSSFIPLFHSILCVACRKKNSIDAYS